MIKSEHGVLTAKGSIVELLADLSVIIYGLNKDITAKTDENTLKCCLTMFIKKHL